MANATEQQGLPKKDIALGFHLTYNHVYIWEEQEGETGYSERKKHVLPGNVSSDEVREQIEGEEAEGERNRIKAKIQMNGNSKYRQEGGQGRNEGGWMNVETGESWGKTSLLRGEEKRAKSKTSNQHKMKISSVTQETEI